MTGEEREAVHALIRDRLSELGALPLTIEIGGCRHGTEAGYRKGCRCYECRDAARVARNKRRGRVQTHNANGYSNGCRCDVCRLAHKVRQREKRRSRVVAADVGVEVLA